MEKEKCIVCSNDIVDHRKLQVCCSSIHYECDNDWLKSDNKCPKCGEDKIKLDNKCYLNPEKTYIYTKVYLDNPNFMQEIAKIKADSGPCHEKE